MPIPQPRPRISMRGGFARAYTPADHPIVAFRKSVIAAALEVQTKASWHSSLGQTVRVRADFNFVRPKSHYRSGGRLKDDAPPLPRPDVDNLAKGVLDALTMAGVWEDDVVVACLVASKRYVSAKLEPHTVIEIL